MLSEEQRRAVEADAPVVKILACAGAGKTETLAQRVLRRLADGVPPEQIVALSFTEKAAGELKERIYRRAGNAAAVARIFAGTIHGYCLERLRDLGLEAIDEHRERALIFRAGWELGLFKLPHNRMEPAEVCRQFLRAVNVVYNERLDRKTLAPESFAKAFAEYESLLARLRLINFGQLIERAADRPEPAPRELFVDEAQDLNPAQAELIRRLAEHGTRVTLVGDESQAIYQWRGADASIFANFPGETYRLTENRRSRPGIIAAANGFGTAMRSLRPSAPSVFVHRGDDEVDWIVERIDELRTRGYAYSDMAVLFRSMRTSAGPLLEKFAARGIPYTVSGPSGLFRRPEVQELAKIFAWLADEPLKLQQRGAAIRPTFDLDHLRRGHYPGLIPLFHDILRVTGFLELEDPTAMANLGRFSELLADYEAASRRVDVTGRAPFWGGWEKFLKRLVWFINGYANESYEERSAAVDRDAVSVSTVHQAKGLEWPIVFVPCLVDARFPSSLTGREQPWLIDRELFKADRYEGEERDERRLFYVALTRARDALFLSSFESTEKRAARPSRFLEKITSDRGEPAAPEPTLVEPDTSIVPVGDILLYRRCPYRFRLARIWGFQPALIGAQGYGHAVHEILRRAAAGKVVEPARIEQMAAQEFYVPFATGRMRESLRRAAVRDAGRYARQHREALARVEQVEFRIEFPARNAVILGVVDAILSGVEVRDYKTAEDPRLLEDAALQVRLYAAGLRAQGRGVTAGSIADLSGGRLYRVDVSPTAVQRAVAQADEAIAGMQSGAFEARPGPDCRRCELRAICKFAPRGRAS
jgi:DNA helicase-2/ATP-dependent DNA helicase PcrA